MKTKPHVRYDRIWVKTTIICPLCDQPVYREVLKQGLSPFDNFACDSMGCKFVNHPANIYALTLWDFHDSIARCTKKVKIIESKTKVKAYSNIIPGSIHIELPPPPKFKITDPHSAWVRGFDFTPVKLKHGEFKRL